MNYNFEYAGLVTYTGQLYVEDIANTYLHFSNGSSKDWYLKIITDLGESQIYTYGPISWLDETTITYISGYIHQYEKISYSEKKLITKINKFIHFNNEIQQAEEICADEFTYFESRLNNAKYY